jgi:hypothetical protein
MESERRSTGEEREAYGTDSTECEYNNLASTSVSPGGNGGGMRYGEARDAGRGQDVVVTQERQNLRGSLLWREVRLVEVLRRNVTNAYSNIDGMRMGRC